MKKRPAGISILAFIYILVGMLGIMMNPTSISHDWTAYLIYAALVVSAAALYLRHRWAWWLLGTLTAFSILVNCINLFVTLAHPEALSDEHRLVMKFAGKLLLQSLILVYFFSQPVMKFFGFSTDNKPQKLFILLGGAGMIYLILIFT